jgi:hypothetical protein
MSSLGYDSCGIATIDKEAKNFEISKFINEARFGGDCLEKLSLAIQ